MVNFAQQNRSKCPPDWIKRLVNFQRKGALIYYLSNITEQFSKSTEQVIQNSKHFNQHTDQLNRTHLWLRSRICFIQVQIFCLCPSILFCLCLSVCLSLSLKTNTLQEGQEQHENVSLILTLLLLPFLPAFTWEKLGVSLEGPGCPHLPSSLSSFFFEGVQKVPPPIYIVGCK